MSQLGPKASGHGRPRRRIDTLSYYDVHCSRQSFLEWLTKSAKENQPVETESAQAAAVENSEPRKKRKPGQRPRYEETWNRILKSMALDIDAEIGPYYQKAEVLQKELISLIIARFKR